MEIFETVESNVSKAKELTNKTQSQPTKDQVGNKLIDKTDQILTLTNRIRKNPQQTTCSTQRVQLGIKMVLKRPGLA